MAESTSKESTFKEPVPEDPLVVKVTGNTSLGGEEDLRETVIFVVRYYEENRNFCC